MTPARTATPHAEDRALAERMRAGDQQAAAEIMARCAAPLYRYALAHVDGDRDLALDTVQSAVTKALGRLETYRGESSLLTWLCACCRNEILMHHRRLRTAPPSVELDDAARPAPGSLSRPEPDPESTLLRVESARLVHSTLDLLPERYARVLEWKYVEQLPVDEIAARLGVRSKAAESLLTRARAAFRREYVRLAADTAPSSIDREREPGGQPQ